MTEQEGVQHLIKRNKIKVDRAVSVGFAGGALLTLFMLNQSNDKGKTQQVIIIGSVGAILFAVFVDKFIK